MRGLTLKVATLLVALTGTSIANAVPLVYDFTATGTLTAWTGVGETHEVFEAVSFTGWITLDVLAAGPNGTDGETDGVTYAKDARGWVNSDFYIDWGTGVAHTVPVPGSGSTDIFVEVDNDRAGSDSVVVGARYIGQDGSVGYVSSAQLIRNTPDLSWLDDLSFNPDAGLAPGGSNLLFFDDFTRAFDGQTLNYSGYSGILAVTSLTARSVPEPASSVLFCIGLLGLAVQRWPRASAFLARYANKKNPNYR